MALTSKTKDLEIALGVLSQDFLLQSVRATHNLPPRSHIEKGQDMTEPQPRWTQEESIAYECACEAIIHLMAIKTSLIYDEKEKEQPDISIIERLTTERSGLHQELNELQLKDHARIKKISSEYGAILRSYMEKNKNNL